MTSDNFVIWLRGFVEACHEYAPTPKQWDQLKEKLEQVADPSKVIKHTTIGSGGHGFVTTTTGIPEEVASFTVKQQLND